MTDPHNIPFANHILSSIQKDLTVLKDHQVLDERTLQSILALLPPTAVTPRHSFTHSPLPSPSPAPSPVMNSGKPPLPTRKSTSTSHSPHSTPIPAPRTPSFPKLPVRRGTPDRQPPSRAIVNEPSALQPPSYTATEKNQHWAEAIFDYSGEDTKTDLSFRKGDKIQVTEHVNADWWRGTLHGKSGIFPQNHVQPVTPMVHPATEEQAPGKVHDMTKKFGSRVGEAAVFGFGATVGSEAAHAIF